MSRKRWPNWSMAGGGHHLSHNEEGGELQVSIWICSVPYANAVVTQELEVLDVTTAMPLWPHMSRDWTLECCCRTVRNVCNCVCQLQKLAPGWWPWLTSPFKSQVHLVGRIWLALRTLTLFGILTPTEQNTEKHRKLEKRTWTKSPQPLRTSA